MMKTNHNLITFIFIGALMLASCRPSVRVGELQTKTQTVKLDRADSVDVEILAGAGELNVTGGASELLDASFTYNVEELNPRATYSNGKLVVKESDVSIGISSFTDLAEYSNKWDLKLNEDVPMEMHIELGVGLSTLSLGTLALTSLNIDGGAGEVIIDLTGDWKHNLDASIEGGLGSIRLELPKDVGVRVEIDPGVGIVDASHFKKDGNTYTNDAFGVSSETLRIHIDGGVGQIKLVIV